MSQGDDAAEARAHQARERAFHDRWAEEEQLDEESIRAAFEHLAAVENRFILRRMGDLRGKRVLDVGSGRGESAIYFALQGAEVTATDISPKMCELCERTARAMGVRLETKETGAETLDVPPGAYDIVYGANVLHHVTSIPDVVDATARALREDGEAFFWDPLAYNPAINVYRRLAADVRSVDEAPLTFAALDAFRRRFPVVEHREFWLSTLALFLKYYFWDRVDPNEARYWKIIYDEDERRLGRWFGPLQRLDARLLSLPGVRRLAWNMVIHARHQR